MQLSLSLASFLTAFSIQLRSMQDVPFAAAGPAGITAAALTAATRESVEASVERRVAAAAKETGIAVGAVAAGAFEALLFDAGGTTACSMVRA